MALSCQVTRKFKWATTLEITAISAIIFILCVCPAWASVYYIKYSINLEGALPERINLSFRQEVPSRLIGTSYAQKLRSEALVSRKLVHREVCSEARLTGRAGKRDYKLASLIFDSGTDE